MTPGRDRRHLAVAIALGDIVAYVIAIVASGFAASFWLVPFTGGVVAFSLVGALLVWRVPSNHIGVLLLAAATSIAVGVAVSSYATIGAGAKPGPWLGAAIAGEMSQTFLLAGIIIVLIVIPLVFPDGSLLSRRWRWIVWLAVIAVLDSLVSSLFRPGPAGFTGLENPLGAPALVPLLDIFDGFTAALSVVGFGSAAAAVFLRFRRGGPTERQQLKWFLAVAGVAAITFSIAAIMPIAEVRDAIFYIGSFVMVALPLAIGIAILRYRLYDIDRVISRTISYGLITALLVIVFLVVNLGLQSLLSFVTTGNSLAVAGSTLLAAALFTPVRRRVQRIVDRRFDRARYDGERTASAFSVRMRDATDLPTVAADLDGTVRRAIAPSSVGLWLRGSGR